jgi:hypothetical protein
LIPAERATFHAEGRDAARAPECPKQDIARLQEERREHELDIAYARV